MVFGHTSSQDDDPSVVGCHRHGVNPRNIWNPVLIKNGSDDDKQNQARTPGNIFYPQWCPISSRGSHPRRNTTCLQWHHLSAQDWKWGCCSETHTRSVLSDCAMLNSFMCNMHASHFQKSRETRSFGVLIWRCWVRVRVRDPVTQFVWKSYRN